MRLLLAGAITLFALAPAPGEVLLWDNGERDNRSWINAETTPQDARKDSRVTEVADDFENNEPWEITAVSFDGLFAWFKAKQDDGSEIKESGRVEVRIYKPDDKGLPGEVFWELTLEGEDAWETQVFGSDLVNMGPKSFRDATMSAAKLEGLPVTIDIVPPDGPFLLPAGRWFFAWKVFQTVAQKDPERHFNLFALTSDHPRPDFAGDLPLHIRDGIWAQIRRDGMDSLRWTPRPPSMGKPCNTVFRIYGERK